MRIPDALLAAYRKYEAPHRRGPHFAAVVYAIEHAMKHGPVTPSEVLDWLGEPDMLSPDGDRFILSIQLLSYV